MIDLDKAKKKMSLSEVAKSPDRMLALSQFLDDFNRSSNKLTLIDGKPQSEGVSALDLCLMAAVAHKLAVDNNISVPEWVHEREYVMSHPVYAHGTKNKEYQRYLKETTPREFAERNIYYGANVMERV